MQKITQEEMDKIEFKTRGQHYKSVLYLELEKLQIGEIIKIEKHEWKKPVINLISNISNIGKSLKVKFIFRTIVDGSGWIVKRIA